MLLDELLPRWHFRERHARATNLPAAALVTAVERLTWDELPVMRALMSIRAGGRLRLRERRRILDDMAVIGFVVLARSSDELVFAAVGRPWAPGGEPPPRLADQPDPARFFAGFAAPGWAKMVATFQAGGGELRTETRVLLTDERSRRAFGRYWLFIRPFSGLIRRRWLAAAIRRAGRT